MAAASEGSRPNSSSAPLGARDACKAGSPSLDLRPVFVAAAPARRGLHRHSRGRPRHIGYRRLATSDPGPFGFRRLSVRTITHRGGPRVIPVRHSSDGRALLVVSRNSVAFEILHGETVERDWNSVLLSIQPAFGRSPVRARIGRKLAFPSASFDVIYLSHVLEHHQDHQLVPALRDMHRLLKAGGVLRISTPDV